MKKIIITEEQAAHLINELNWRKLMNKLSPAVQDNPESDIEPLPREFEFSLNYPNRIYTSEYVQLKSGEAIRFYDDEVVKLSLLSGEWKPAFLNHYEFEYTRENFGEPTIIIEVQILKYKKYYLTQLIYKIRLHQTSGMDFSYGMFPDFKTLLKFLDKLKTIDVLKDE